MIRKMKQGEENKIRELIAKPNVHCNGVESFD